MGVQKPINPPEILSERGLCFECRCYRNSWQTGCKKENPDIRSRVWTIKGLSVPSTEMGDCVGATGRSFGHVGLNVYEVPD
jgi:hypothetical protein